MLQAMKTVTWPLKWGMPNSTMVQLVNKSISQRKATILGDTLVSFLLSAFDLSNISPETNFIRLLSKSPMQRPQAAAELLLYLVLWSPWTASHADDVRRLLRAVSHSPPPSRLGSVRRSNGRSSLPKMQRGFAR